MDKSRCGACMNRRQFLATAAGTASLAVLAGCGDGNVSVAPGQTVTLPGGPVTIRISDYPGLANIGELAKVNGAPIAVKRTSASSFDAISLRCTHQGCLVGITSNEQLDCGCHGSRFGNDGEVLRGPNTGESINRLPKFPTSFDSAANELTIG